MKLFYLLLIFTALLFGSENRQATNKKYRITTETLLKTDYLTKISPYYYAHKLHYFDSFDGVKIAYKIFHIKNAKANIVISSGRTEGMVKYQELLYDLNRNGYSVYIFDHRGQGNSERLLEDPEIGHVKHFENYVKDMHHFVKNYLPKDKKRILIAHSMGGAIASLYVEKYLKDFTALVLSSPMHQPLLVGEQLNTFACELVEKRKRDIDRYIIGEGSYSDSLSPFSENILTHSKIRYEITETAFEMEPETKLGGPSVRWVSEACRASQQAVEDADKIEIPILLLQASEDKVVSLQAQDEFCEKSKKVCKKREIKNAYHELFIEKDSIRTEVLNALFSFIDAVLSH
jgi:lysophospholipase